MNDLEILTQQLEETNTLIGQLNSVSAYLQERHAALTASITVAEEEAAAIAAAEQAKWEAQKALDALQQQQIDALEQKIENIDQPEQDIVAIVNNLVAQVDKLKSWKFVCKESLLNILLLL